MCLYYHLVPNQWRHIDTELRALSRDERVKQLRQQAVLEFMERQRSAHCREQLTFSTQITVCTNTCQQLSGLVTSHNLQNKVPQRKRGSPVRGDSWIRIQRSCMGCPSFISAAIIKYPKNSDLGEKKRRATVASHPQSRLAMKGCMHTQSSASSLPLLLLLRASNQKMVLCTFKLYLPTSTKGIKTILTDIPATQSVYTVSC